jgi:hypothetical protein
LQIHDLIGARERVTFTLAIRFGRAFRIIVPYGAGFIVVAG